MARSGAENLINICICFPCGPRICDNFAMSTAENEMDRTSKASNEREMNSRTGRISRYVRYGYPYGDLKPAQRTAEMKALRKPGWLPTAIVVNILVAGDERRGRRVSSDHLIAVETQESGTCSLVMPSLKSLEESDLAPLEVIDGHIACGRLTRRPAKSLFQTTSSYLLLLSTVWILLGRRICFGRSMSHQRKSIPATPLISIHF